MTYLELFKLESYLSEVKADIIRNSLKKVTRGLTNPS